MSESLAPSRKDTFEDLIKKIFNLGEKKGQIGIPQIYGESDCREMKIG